VLLSHLFGCLQYPEIFIKADFTFANRSHLEPNQGNRAGVLYQ